MEASDKTAPETVSAIWKVTMPIADDILLDLPLNSTLLKVGDQGGGGQSLDFWFLVEDVKTPSTESRRLHVAGTGHPVDPMKWAAADYWDSVVTLGGALVWHVFLEGER